MRKRTQRLDLRVISAFGSVRPAMLAAIGAPTVIRVGLFACDSETKMSSDMFAASARAHLIATFVLVVRLLISMTGWLYTVESHCGAALRRFLRRPNQSPEPTWLATADSPKAIGIYHVMVPTWLSFGR